MAKSQHVEDRRLRRKTAAFRLKHDVGKALRWSAPETRETEEDLLRARLCADLLPRASGGAASRDVLQIFFEWKKEEGPMFGADDADLEALGLAMERIAAGREFLSPSSPSKRSLSLSSLVALDDACLEAARACTAFYRRIAVDDGPEIVRPSGVYPRRGGRS